ncbi:MAG: 2-hydroxyglutaryl-CoA dehydratase [Nitrospinae bacterium]|nr:2-hydroxyglutaryl-CoA dehydratase [Nitrospinota bacterium]
MAVAGVDMGALATKVVILEGNRILAASTLVTGEVGEIEARRAMEEALKQAGLKMEDLKAVVSTGTGRKSIPFAQKQRTAMSCHAKGAYFLFPQARVIRLSADGKVEDSVGNDKCAAGTGVFLDAMSRMLRVPLEEMGEESLQATGTVSISSMCVIFAESEVISHVHKDPPVPRNNILAGIHESIVDRLFGMTQRVGVLPEVVMTGGVAKNIGIVHSMEEKLGVKVLVAPDPQIVGALGAALLAQQS